MSRPRLLFLDEPTVGVDPQSRNHIFETILRLRDEGMTLLYTTHYMEEADRLCDNIGVMDRGRLIALDTPVRAQVRDRRSRRSHAGAGVPQPHGPQSPRLTCSAP